MTGQVGTLSLGVGVAASVAATLLWLRLALITGTPPAAPRLARLATGTTLLTAALACGALEWALLRHDFSVRFVAENGGRHVPPYYTVTSLWSALDGSLLLWLLILAGYATLLGRARSAGDRRLHHFAMSTVSTVGTFFFALAYFAANPFQPVRPVPADGPGPNPLLQQHPAMGLHPPLLYAGYIGLVVPFAYALAGLLSGRSGGAWLVAARNWTLPAWALLTAGITLGAWWSYAVLGWGGYWAWDPVENASLLPWLTATAFLHTVMSRRARGPTGWPVGLACASFLLVLLGTFLTRSGVVASVHTFTESPLGPMLLGFILLATVGTVVLIARRSRPEVPQSASARPLSRSTALLGNRILLTTIATVVLLGTVFPLIAQATTGSRAAVGPAYFNRTAVPLAVALLALMGLASLLRPGAHRPGELAHRGAVPAGAGLATVAVTGLLSRPGSMALAAFGCAAFALVATTGALLRKLRGGSGTPVPEPAGVGVRRLAARLAHRRRLLAGTLAHAGIALVAVGVAASSAYTVSTERELTIGQSIRVNGASARLAAIDRASDGRAMRVRARLVVTSGNQPAGPAAPALVYYPRRDSTISVPTIRAGLVRDTYTTLVAVSADGGSATVRLAVNPMMSMIWAGGALTALGGLLAIGGRRRGSRFTSRPSPRSAGRPAAAPAATPRANLARPVPAAGRTSAEGTP